MAKREDWEIIEYDVWGNKRDGWEVNQWFNTGVYISLPEDFTDAQVIAALRKADRINPGTRASRIGIESHEDDIFISDNKNGRPEFALRRRGS